MAGMNFQTRSRIRKIKGDTSSSIIMYLPDSKTYDQAKKLTLTYMGHENSRMSIEDIYADVDAVNLAAFKFYLNENLYNSVTMYYKGKSPISCKKRFAVFIKWLSTIEKFDKHKDPIENFREIVSFYTQKVDKKDWLLIITEKVKGAELSVELRRGIRDGFTEFVKKKINAEYGGKI